MNLTDAISRSNPMPPEPIIEERMLDMIDRTYFYGGEADLGRLGIGNAREVRDIFDVLAAYEDGQPFQEAATSMVGPLWIPEYPNQFAWRNAQIFEDHFGLRVVEPVPEAMLASKYKLSTNSIKHIQQKEQALLRSTLRVAELVVGLRKIAGIEVTSR